MPSSLIRLVATAVAAVVLIPATAHAADVAAVGAQQKLTAIGPDGNLAFSAHEPTIAYNSRDDEFLLAWLGRDPLAPGETEVYGQVLDGTGKPKGIVRRLSFVTGTNAPEQPVLGYSPAVNSYMLAYVAPPLAAPNNPAGQQEVIGQVVTATGVPSGDPARISNTDAANADADQVSDPALAYDPSRDQFRFVWLADQLTESDFEVVTRRVSSTLIDPDGIGDFTVSAVAAGDADDPVIAFLPKQNRYAVAWEAALGAGRTGIAAEVMSFDGGIFANDVPVSTATTGVAVKPSIAANPDRDEVLISFVKNDIANEGPETFVQRLSAAGAQIPGTADTRISTMGPDSNLAFGANLGRNTTATYHPLLDRYFVTWTADNDFPGLVDQEFERYGQALDAAGAEVGGDDLRLSANGVDGNASAVVENGATAASLTRRAWLHVWAADDNRPPLADNEFELFGRLAGDDGDLDGATAPADCNDADASIRPGATEVIDNGIDEDCSGADIENLDRDADGSSRPADCNDANPSVRPGAADAPDNAVDEDCSGADAVNFDRDGDGSLRPVDCNDANAAIRPGARDIPRNKVDEDCSGKDAAFPNLGANVSNAWDVDGAQFKLLTLAVTQQFPKGMKASIRCSGSGCPFNSKTLKLSKVRRSARNAITSLTPKQRRFRAGQTIEVLVSAPGFNTKVARMQLKFNKVPRTQALCALPGSSKPQKSCG